MNLDEVVNAVLNIPKRFWEENVVFMKLLRESGYCSAPNEITEDLIRDALFRHREFLADWKIWSEDKRTDGWFWKKTPNGTYEVKHAIGEPWRITEVLSYPDEESACAAFIKREIEDYRTWSRHSNS